MATVAFEEVICRKLSDTKSKYRLVFSSDAYQQGELRSSYHYGAHIIGWTDPFENSITLSCSGLPIHITLDLRRRANFREHIMGSYSLDLNSNCDSKTFLLQSSPLSPDSPPEIHVTLTITGLAKDSTRPTGKEFDATNPAANSSPLSRPLEAPAGDATSSDLANVKPPTVPQPAPGDSEEVVSGPPSALFAGPSSLVTQLDAAQGATHEAADRRAKLYDRDLPLSVLAGNEAAPDFTAVGVATWDGVQCVKSIVDFFDGVAEIHPVANATWKILTLAYKLKQQQSQTDEKIDKLVKLMDANCRLAAVLVKNQLGPEAFLILKNILEAVKNGATVVEEYCCIRQSFLSSFKLVGSTIASRLEACLEVLNTLQCELGGHTITNIQSKLQNLTLTLSRNHEVLLERLTRLDEDLVARKSEALLSDIVYAKEANRDLRRDTGGCLPQTRGEVIQAIVDWATGGIANASTPNMPGLNGSSRVLWLCGVAGSGKSSIAISVARKLQSMDRLGALYRFEAAQRVNFHLDPSNLFSTITRQLAERRASFRSRLLLALEQIDHNLRASTSPSTQFTTFLAALLAESAGEYDDVVVIDAFDESGSGLDRDAALLALSPEACTPTFPKGIRFILTSRDDLDVARRLERVTNGDQPLCSVLRMEDIPTVDTQRDIESYVTHMLGETYGLEASRAAGDLARLAVKAEHSFQWASTACRYIINNDDHDGAHLPDERLQEILDTRGGLDVLYLSVLDKMFKDSMARESPSTWSLRIILGTLVCALEPVSIHVIHALASANPSVETRDLAGFQFLARKLSSIITGTQNTSSPLLAFHTSFTDFLGDPHRSKTYAVSAPEMHSHLALASLGVMRKWALSDQHDHPWVLPYRGQVDMPIELSYACRYWPAHVAAGLTSGSDEMDPLRAFISNSLDD